MVLGTSLPETLLNPVIFFEDPAVVVAIDVDCKLPPPLDLDSTAQKPTTVGSDSNNNSIHHRQLSNAREYRHSSVLGNYVVAGRPIATGEVIAIETPLSVSAYGPSSRIPYCLSCYKDVALSVRCTKCRWSICDSVCENAPQHAHNECPILCAVKARPRQTSREYTAVETLRCLLLRDRESEKWELVLKMEPHREAREKCTDARAVTAFVMNFIQNRCKLAEQFTEQEICHALGVISVNTFSGYAFVQRNICMLFPPSISYIAHDCNPNIQKTITLKNTAGNPINSSPDPENEQFAIKLTSLRSIEPGETLSINYVDVALSVIDRRCQLLDAFYFYCDCLRCRAELFEELVADCDCLSV